MDKNYNNPQEISTMNPNLSSEIYEFSGYISTRLGMNLSLVNFIIVKDNQDNIIFINK